METLQTEGMRAELRRPKLGLSGSSAPPHFVDERGWKRGPRQFKARCPAPGIGLNFVALGAITDYENRDLSRRGGIFLRYEKQTHYAHYDTKPFPLLG